jgi:hypothetical protein
MTRARQQHGIEHLQAGRRAGGRAGRQRHLATSIHLLRAKPDLQKRRITPTLIATHCKAASSTQPGMRGRHPSQAQTSPFAEAAASSTGVCCLEFCSRQAAGVRLASWYTHIGMAPCREGWHTAQGWFGVWCVAAGWRRRVRLLSLRRPLPRLHTCLSGNVEGCGPLDISRHHVGASLEQRLHTVFISASGRAVERRIACGQAEAG